MALSLLLALALPAAAQFPDSNDSGRVTLLRAPIPPVAAASLEQDLGAGVVRVSLDDAPVEGARRLADVGVSRERNVHFSKPINLPLASGAKTHVALYFGIGRKLGVALTRAGEPSPMYSISELENGVIYRTGGRAWRLSLRGAGHPWRSVLVVSGADTEGAGVVYPIELSDLYWDARGAGVAVMDGERRLGTVLVYSDPLSVQARTLVSFLPDDGFYPGAHVAVLEDVPSGSIGWARMGSSRIGYRLSGDALEVYTAP